ncbi:MAG TPA: hypothetical protein VEW47_11780 [Candidatus Dormibacteraeota bacterium]|nr:hypothetical protein [Candidatus Dormibacteraeota bacterium]
MSRTGWVAVPRAVRDAPWFKEADPFTRDFWMLLMSLAAYAPRTTETDLNLAPGQLVTSWKSLAEQMAWTENRKRKTPTLAKCRWAAEFLRNAGEAAWTPTGAPHYTGIVVTLERWALYAVAGETVADTTTDTTADRLLDTTARSEEELQGSAGRARKTPFERQQEKYRRDEEEGRRLIAEERRRQTAGLDALPEPGGADVH